MWQIVLKQKNLNIQACFIKNNNLNKTKINKFQNTNDFVNQIFDFNFENNAKKFLKNQFASVCAQNKSYQKILKALKIE